MQSIQGRLQKQTAKMERQVEPPLVRPGRFEVVIAPLGVNEVKSWRDPRSYPQACSPPRNKPKASQLDVRT